ncbi:hypothetical protein Plhal304r1_c068g0155731 [Plasmopara halstedii]
MSTDYEARMEILQRKREDLTAQRQAIEKRMALHEATAVEFSTVAVQSLRKKCKAQRSAAFAAKKRNDDFVRTLHETQKQVHDTWSKLQSDHSGSSALLAKEKKRYNCRIEQVYPAWQKQLHRQRVQKLKELEDKKRTVERRRYLAKKSFEKEQMIDDLLKETRHEVELAENLEHNEHYERILLRTKSTNQAIEVEHNIQEMAQEARSILQQHAERYFETAPEIVRGLSEKLTETFSPRNTLRALQEGGSFFELEKRHSYEDNDFTQQQKFEIAANSDVTDAVQSNYDGFELKAHEKYFEDSFIEPLCNFDERSAFLDSAATVSHNSYTEISHKYSDQSIHDAGHSEVSRAVAAKSTDHDCPLVDTISKDLCADTQRLGTKNNLASSTTHDKDIRQPCEILKKVPTLVAEALSTIPEDDETIFSSRADRMVRHEEIAHQRELRGSDVATSSAATSHIPVNISKFIQELPAVSTPANIAEESKSGYSAMLVASTFHIEDNRDDINQDEAESLKIISIGNPYHDKAAENSNETPLPISNDDSCCKAEDKISPLEPEVKEHICALKKGSVSSQIEFDASSNTDVLAIVDFTGPLSIEETPRVANKCIVDIKPVALDILMSEHMSDLISHHDKAGSFHDPKELSNIATAKSSSDSIQTLATIEKSFSEIASEEAIKSLPPPGSNIKEFVEPVLLSAAMPATTQHTRDNIVLSSKQSDDYDLPSCTTVDPTIPCSNNKVEQDDPGAAVSPIEDLQRIREAPSITKGEKHSYASITEKLSPVDRMKALEALISRVEEGVAEGDNIYGSREIESSYDSKRELMRMAIGGHKAQIAYFGSDICFELILEISRDLGPVLFPFKSFEGIMNDQKMRKLHQSNKDKQLDLWKALSHHFKQLVELKAISVATLVDLSVAAFLAHDLENQRSQRKLREFLTATLEGGGGNEASSLRKMTSAIPEKLSFSSWQEQQKPVPEPLKPDKAQGKVSTSQLLQTAFLHQQSAPKSKVFGIASSSLKEHSKFSSDVLMSMSSRPMKLSEKLMRGGKIDDYSEFEEEEEVDLQNLIGTKPVLATTLPKESKPDQQATMPQVKRSMEKVAVVEGVDDDFDADF